MKPSKHLRPYTPTQHRAARRKVGEALLRLRKTHGLNQKELGALFGLGQAAISRIESAQQNIPTHLFYLLCVQLSAEMGEVFVDSSAKNPLKYKGESFKPEP